MYYVYDSESVCALCLSMYDCMLVCLLYVYASRYLYAHHSSELIHMFIVDQFNNGYKNTTEETSFNNNVLFL